MQKKSKKLILGSSIIRIDEQISREVQKYWFWSQKCPIYPIFGIIKILLKKWTPSISCVYWSSNSSKKIRKSNDPIRRKLYYRLTCRRTKLNLLKSSAIGCLHNDGITISVHFSRHRFRVLITLNTFWTEMFPLPGWLEKLSIYQFWKDATNNKSFW